jgi:hypothetical protein
MRTTKLTLAFMAVALLLSAVPAAARVPGPKGKQSGFSTSRTGQNRFGFVPGPKGSRAGVSRIGAHQHKAPKLRQKYPHRSSIAETTGHRYPWLKPAYFGGGRFSQDGAAGNAYLRYRQAGGKNLTSGLHR